MRTALPAIVANSLWYLLREWQAGSEQESEESYGRLSVVESSPCPSRATRKRPPGNARERPAQAARQHDLVGRGWLPVGDSPRRHQRSESSGPWHGSPGPADLLRRHVFQQGTDGPAH